MPQWLLRATDQIEETVGLAKHVGMGVEIQAFSVPDTLDDPALTLAMHRDALADFPGRVALHGPFSDLYPGSRDRLVREAAWARAQGILPLAAELGVTDLVLHHGYIPGACDRDEWLTHSIDFWRRYLEICPRHVAVHLENVVERKPGELLALLDALNDPRLGACLDVGHAHAFSPLTVIDWIQALGDRLRYVHLNDNWGEKDAHLPLGHGGLPMREILAALTLHAPDMPWTIECDARPSLAWLRRNNLLS